MPENSRTFLDMDCLVIMEWGVAGYKIIGNQESDRNWCRDISTEVAPAARKANRAYGGSSGDQYANVRQSITALFISDRIITLSGTRSLDLLFKFY